MIQATNLHKVYGQGPNSTHALKGINLHIKPGEFVAIMGRSGSGKSTLLHLLGLLDKPTSGIIQIEDKDVLTLTDDEKSDFRLKELGYVFQEYSLVQELSVLENVFLPALCVNRRDNFRKKGMELLEIVGLEKRYNHYPHEISGGEQQRAAIARALINQPKILFADEPTASLDITSAKIVLDLFKKFNRELEQTIVMVTHEPEDEKHVDRVIWLSDGLIEG
jgi:putative ABC transport system ATP-binding protein